MANSRNDLYFGADANLLASTAPLAGMSIPTTGADRSIV